MIPAFIASVEVMLERWRQHDGKEIELSHEFKILTSEMISRTAFGSSYLEGQHIFDTLETMVDIVVRNNFKMTIPVIGYDSYLTPIPSYPFVPC
jgi:PHYB activation tagged suppressor 1